MNRKQYVIIVAIIVLGIVTLAIAQSILQNGGPITNTNGTMVMGSDGTLGHFLSTDTSGRLVTVGASGSVADPCTSSATAKQSVSINISTATTTSLVSPSGSTAVYVCGFSVSISEVVTTANTIQFEYGTGATCGTGTTVLTGQYGAGGVTAAAPIVVSESAHITLFKAPASNGLCALTAIGATGNFAGVLTYVQQ